MKHVKYVNVKLNIPKDFHNKEYFKCLRELFLKLEKIEEARAIMVEYNVMFVDIDDLPRVNIDFPAKEVI